jgi:hypothetical protein
MSGYQKVVGGDAFGYALRWDRYGREMVGAAWQDLCLHYRRYLDCSHYHRRRHRHCCKYLLFALPAQSLDAVVDCPFYRSRLGYRGWDSSAPWTYQD